jgi:hypothetical protein
MDETVAVHLPPPPSKGGRPGRAGRGSRLPRWPWLVGALVVALAAGAVLLPAATVHITPATSPVPPQSFPVEAAVAGRVTQDLEATASGTATGERAESVPASGVVTFFNWNTVAVEVPQGTQVSVGGTTAFVTLERVVVPRGKFGAPITPGEKSVQVAAVVAGEGGNVAAKSIDTIDDASVRGFLRGFPENPNRLVENADPTSGGLETTHTVIQQSDIDAAVAAVQADLRQKLSEALGSDPDRLYADAPTTELPAVEVPDDLLGTEDRPTFELTGTLHVDRAYASLATVEGTAGEALLAPVGTSIIPDSVQVEVRSAVEQGGTLLVQVTVRAEAAELIDEAALRERIAGKTRAEATAELADLGEVRIDLWPAWVDRVPIWGFRIDIAKGVNSTDSGRESPSGSVH